MRKIYFAGSIRGGRNDAELYRKIIRHISRTEKVLTEHIGNADVEEEEKQMTDQDIYEQDTTWLRECDMVIAECTNASLGVGYEMAYAELHKKPVHIFYDRTRARLSAILTPMRRNCSEYWATFSDARAQRPAALDSGIAKSAGSITRIPPSRDPARDSPVQEKGMASGHSPTL